MKTRAALALSLTGILLTGSAALAATTQARSNSGTGISDDAKNVLRTDDSAAKSTAVSPARAIPKATKASDDKQADDKNASAAKKASRPAEAGDDKGGLRSAPATAAEPGDDKGGLVKAPEPGDDSGGHGDD